MMQEKNPFHGHLLSVFFGSRKAAFISLLFCVALSVLMYIAYRQVQEAAHIELPTGQTAIKTPGAPFGLLPVPKEVLVLNSYHAGHTFSDKEMTGIIETLQSAAPGISYMIEYLDCKHHPGYEHFGMLRDLFTLKYGNRDIPVVIVADNPALDFALKYRATLFPRSTIVFCGVNNYKKEMLWGQKNITGLAESLDAANTMRAALTLHPGTRKVFVLHDYTSTGVAIRRETEEQLKGLSEKVSFRYEEYMSRKELTKFLRELPRDSLVLALTYSVFRDGEVMAHEDVARLFSANSPVPVYGVHQERLGYGIVGGSLLSGQLHGAQAARVALQVLSGTPAATIPVDMHPPTRMMFDYNQLARFGIPVGALPENSLVVNRPVSFIASHKYLVVSTLLVIMVLTSGIIILGFTMYRRDLAEDALRKAKEELEMRVSERTAELHGANESLQSELAERRRIHEQLQLSEMALRKREADLNESQRLAHIGSWDWDADSDVIWWSDEYYRIYNLDPNLPTPGYAEHLSVYTPESREQLDAAVKKAMDTGEPYELDLELAEPTPETKWILARGEVRRDADGRIVGLRGTAQNITDRKTAEDHILRLNEELEQRVKDRTAELQAKNRELEQANRLFVGRELRMIELKQKIMELQRRSGHRE